jgi:hypothetical protein
MKGVVKEKVKSERWRDGRKELVGEKKKCWGEKKGGWRAGGRK